MASKTSETDGTAPYSKQVSIPFRIYDVLRRLSEHTGVSQSLIIRRCLAAYFENHPSEAEAVGWDPDLAAAKPRGRRIVVGDPDPSRQGSKGRQSRP